MEESETPKPAHGLIVPEPMEKGDVSVTPKPVALTV
jgi:hypothetical protein